jgi:transposase-like protein
MKKTKAIEGRRCPKCGSDENQVSFGKNRSGTQRCRCKICKATYTLNPKERAYAEEVRAQAIETYYSGVSGRGVGKMLGMNKSNVYNWIKKNGSGADK